jgi:MFS family permease
MIGAFILMVIGRSLLSAAPYLGLARGVWSSFSALAVGGILITVIGYGAYMPAAYAAVRQLTTEKTSAMAYAMLYALMNLGGWLPTFFTSIREAVGISGAFWVFVGFTVLSLLLTATILTRRTVERAIADASREREAAQSAEQKEKTAKARNEREEREAGREKGNAALDWLRNHPLADPKFSFFVFCLIPVQTLFAHNWLTLPMYVERAYRTSWPWISKNFEKAVNFNPLLVFVLVPMVAAITRKRKVYSMMILGTLVMALPAFLLALGPYPWTLTAYLLVMTVGEAIWQPRFLQYAAEIAPEGRTGQYMGVAQFPWFLTKLIVPFYSGWFLQRYCPASGALETETIWLVYGLIAIASPLLLFLARGWVGKDFKTRSTD